MRVALAIVVLLVTVGFNYSAEASRVEVDQSQYSCGEIKSILNQHGSIWVKNRLFPFVWQNIALHDPVCNGSARSHPRRICRWYEGKVTAKDGRCRLGTECSCRAPNDDDD